MKNLNLLGSLVLVSLLFFSCEKEAEFIAEEDSTEILPTTAAKDVSFGSNSGGGRDFHRGGYYSSVSQTNGTAKLSQKSDYNSHFTFDYTGAKVTVGGFGWRNGNNRTINYSIVNAYGSRIMIGAYGWTTGSENVEYYVVEFGNGAIDGSYERMGNYRANGKTYTYYRRWVTNEPCAYSGGNCNFWQYKSIRNNQPNNPNGQRGQIDMGRHADLWKYFNRQREGANKFGNYAEYQIFGMESFSTRGNVSAGINAYVWK